MADETRQLATFAATLAYTEVPPQVRLRAIDIVVDQIGCQIGCSHLAWAKQVLATFSRIGGLPEATVARYGDRLPMGAAAFINSTFGHAMEYDDGNPIARGHPGAELVPTLLAAAEREHTTGVDFLAALIAAYEVRSRIGSAIGSDSMARGGPQTSTACGPFGVAAGVARILALDVDGIYNALGIAGTYSGGLMQYDHGGGSVKRIYSAVAGSGGIQAALLAQAGLTGPHGIVEGARGLLKIYASSYRPERLVAGLGQKWMIESVRFKPYSCVGGIHPAIDSLKQILSTSGVTVNDIESVEVGYPRGTHEHVGITSPQDLLGMQFSTSYSLALTAIKGRNTPQEYNIERLNDPQVRDLASRIRVYADAELTKMEEGRQPARVRLRSRQGKLYEHVTIYAKGSPGAPLSSADIDAKFRSQVIDVLGTEGCEELLSSIRGIENLGDVATLAPHFVVKTLN